MPRKHRQASDSGCVVVLVDDDDDYLSATRVLLESEGHQVFCAKNGTDALAVLASHPADLLLLDYFMPGLTGEDVVAELRKTNPIIQVVLQTGYSSERPPRDMLKRLDIQGYHDKSEGPEKLLLWADAALKQAAALKEIRKSRQALAYILEATPELHRMRPIAELLPLVLDHVIGLIGATDAFLMVLPEGEGQRAAEPEGFLAMLAEDSELVIRTGCGQFAGGARPEQVLANGDLADFTRAIRFGETVGTETFTLVPLCVRDTTIGIIYLDRPTRSSQDLEHLRILANQAAAAVHNIQLWDMAALDPLTGVHARRFFDRWVLKELHTALRNPGPVALMMIDVDGMKRINDRAGHLGGDQALRRIGTTLRVATRESDVVGRYGGDEFAVLLPYTDMDGAARVGQRIVEALLGQHVDGAAGDVPISCSIGLSELPAFLGASSEVPWLPTEADLRAVSDALIGDADAALYRAKALGGGRLDRGLAASWPAPTR